MILESSAFANVAPKVLGVVLLGGLMGWGIVSVLYHDAKDSINNMRDKKRKDRQK